MNSNHKKNEPIAKKIGDKIERVGEKISHAGAEKIGTAVSRAGDKLEHSADRDFKKNPTTAKRQQS